MESPCDFLLVINSNLFPILRRFQVMADYLSNFRYRDGAGSLLRHRILAARGVPLRMSGQTLPLQKLEGLSCQMLKTAQSYLYSFEHNTGTSRKEDGGTDRPNSTALCTAGRRRLTACRGCRCTHRRKVDGCSAPIGKIEHLKFL